MARVVPETTHDSYAAIIAVVVLAAALIWAQAVIVPLVIAILLMFILTPAVAALQRRGLRRAPAVLLVMSVTLAAVCTLLFAIIDQLHGLARELPSQKENIVRKVRELSGGGPGVIDNLVQMAEEVSAAVNSAPAPASAESGPAPARPQPSKFSTSALLPGAARFSLGLVGSIGLVLILTTSMLLTREDLRNRLLRLAGHSHLTRTTRALEEAARRMSAYLIVQVILNVVFGTLFGLGLAVLGVPYAFLWGVLAAVLRFVPIVGTWLAGVLPLLVSLAQEGWGRPVGVIVWLVVLGVTINSVIEPRLVSRRTGVSAVALVVSVTFWTWLWGPVGLILATPLTVCLAVLGKHVAGLQFLDVLLGTEAVLEAHLGYYQRLLARDEGEAAELIEKYLADRSPAELYDNVMIPALVRAQEDLDRGHITPEDLDFIVRTTRDLLHEVPQPDPGESAADGRPVLVVGCAPHDEREELALELLERSLHKAHVRWELFGSKAVTAEVVDQVADKQPALVCVVTLRPTGVAKARYLCKRLRARFADLTIVAGHWGETDPQEGLAGQLVQAGATHVTHSVRETAEQVGPLLQVQALQQEAALQPGPTVPQEHPTPS